MIAGRFQVHAGNSLDNFSKPWKPLSQIVGTLSNKLQNELGRNFLFLFHDYTRRNWRCCHHFDARFGLVVHVIYYIKNRPFTPPLSNSNHVESLSIRSRASWANEGTKHSTLVAFITFYHSAKSNRYGQGFRFRLECIQALNNSPKQTRLVIPRYFIRAPLRHLTLYNGMIKLWRQISRTCSVLTNKFRKLQINSISINSFPDVHCEWRLINCSCYFCSQEADINISETVKSVLFSWLISLIVLQMIIWWRFGIIQLVQFPAVRSPKNWRHELEK